MSEIFFFLFQIVLSAVYFVFQMSLWLNIMPCKLFYLMYVPCEKW